MAGGYPGGLPRPGDEPRSSPRSEPMDHMETYPTRTIAYLCELFHPPQTPSPEAIQKLHNQYFAAGNPPYSSFAVTPMGPVLSNPGMRPGAVSQVAFLGDRLQFREEMGALTCEGFGERVQQIATDAARVIGIPQFAGQQVTIRTLINPRRFNDAGAYMRDGLFGFGDTTQTFEVEPRILGLRLVFPGSPESPSTNALRIENYAQDPRSLYLENQSSFGPQTLVGDTSALENNVALTYQFLIEKALAFVDTFDQRLEGES